MAQNEIRVVITGDPKRLQTSLATASTAINDLGDDVDRHGSRWDGLRARVVEFGKVAAIGIAAVGVVAAKWGLDAARSAADYGESLNKLNVLMGESITPQLEKWAEANIKNLGMSRKEVMETAGQFTLFGSAMGLQGDQLLGFNESLVQLTADMGSFNNLPTAEVAEMLSAAFRGEYDSLQRIVPLIDNATIVKRALAMTGKSSAEALTAEEKAMATYWEILAQTTAQQGDFARTQDSLPNQMKQVEAAYENIKIEVGEKLLPILNDLLNWFVEDAWPWLEENIPKWKKWWDDYVVPTIGIISDVTAAISKFFDWFGRGIVSMGIAVRNFGVEISNVWNRIQNALAVAIGAIVGGWNLLVAFVGGIPGRIWGALVGMWHGAVAGLNSAIGAIAGGWNMVVAWIAGIPGRIIGLFSGAGSWLWNAGWSIMTGLLDGIRAAWRSVSDFVGSVGGMIKRLKGPLDYDARLLIPEGKAIMAGLGQGLSVGFDQHVEHTVSGITGNLGTAGRWQPATAAPSGGGTHLHFHGPVARDAEAWLLDLIARANRTGAAAIPGVA